MPNRTKKTAKPQRPSQRRRSTIRRKATPKSAPTKTIKIRNQPQIEKSKGEEITMEKITLTVPAMYADHHVSIVKRLLSPIKGVENVVTSAAFKTITVEFDKAKVTQDALVKALTDAGYAPGEEEVILRRPNGRFDPAWENLGVRDTETNLVDLQLSGEFRKY
jgi:copper chaperone CopZ